MRRFVVMAAILAAVSVSFAARAEMSEQDRQARCANNQTRLATLEKHYASYASDEDVARMREGLLAVRQGIKRIQDATQEHPDDRQRTASYLKLWDRLKHLSRSGQVCDQPGFHDAGDASFMCLNELEGDLNKRIDAAVKQIPERDKLLVEIEHARNNLVALQCDMPRNGEQNASDTCRADIGGTWNWSWGHGDQVLGNQSTTISRGPAQFSRDARRGRPADGTMSQSGNSGVWKCDGGSVTFEWSASVDTLSVVDGNHLDGQGKGDNDKDVNWVRVTR